MNTYSSPVVAALDLKYLWFAKGRGGVKYPNYRRDGHRIELTKPGGIRIVGDKDVAAITEAWSRVHATFGTELEKSPAQDQDRQHRARRGGL